MFCCCWCLDALAGTGPAAGDDELSFNDERYMDSSMAELTAAVSIRLSAASDAAVDSWPLDRSRDDKNKSPSAGGV